MDRQQQQSEQPVGLPMTTSIEDPSFDFHENNSCYLEYLVFRKDFKRLAVVLHATVWQRFHLMAHEHPQATNIPPENDVAQVTKSDQIDSLKQRLCPLSTELLWCKENIFLTHCNIYQTFDASHIGCMTCHRDAAVDNICQTASSSVILSPWFILSAVFTGCPKLLHYILSSCVDYHQNNEIIDEIDKGKSHASEEQCLDTTSNISLTFRATQCNKDSKNLCTLHANIDSTVPTAANSRQETNPYPQTMHQLVNSKIACDFPITDTWIQVSINLVISPLHLACWRHDFCSISLLLQHGADPNELAMEQVPDELVQAYDSSELQNTFFRINDNLYFYFDKGLSPLHFIALGLRSPPRYSILEGCKSNIIHDNAAFFQELKKSESSGCNNESFADSLPQISHLKDFRSKTCYFESHGQSDLKDEQLAKRELIINCLEVLLHAGANPNVGQSVLLNGAYPLDIFLQPPPKVYYAPSAARGNQSSIALRLHNLECCADQMMDACETLLCHDAVLSLKFISTYTWRPEFLDCFHLNDINNSQQLVVFLIRFGLFSDRFLADRSDTTESELCSVSVYTSAIIHRFIADVINMSIPVFLTFPVLNWCPVVFLHNIVTTVAKIAEMSGWNDSLKQISELALSLQLRSLKHSCFHVILSKVGYRYSAIWSLPLPARLKRELTHLQL